MDCKGRSGYVAPRLHQNERYTRAIGKPDSRAAAATHMHGSSCRVCTATSATSPAIRSSHVVYGRRVVGPHAGRPALAATSGSHTTSCRRGVTAAAQPMNAPGLEDLTNTESADLSKRQLDLLRGRSASRSPANGRRRTSRDSSGSASPRRQPSPRDEQPPPQQQTQQRAPCIPPLPYWCEAVKVMGLPQDQLVFCFQQPAEAAASARQDTGVAPAFGSAAVELGRLPGQQVQALLDRWQYACAQAELVDLDADGDLWGHYAEAAAEQRRGSVAVGAGDPSPESHGPGLTRRQRRRAARLAKHQAVSQEDRELQEAAREAPSPAAHSRSGSASEDGSSRRRLRIRRAAYKIKWQVCTVRGLPDKSLIFKFGDFEPLPEPPADVAGLPLPADEAGERAAELRRRLLLLQQLQGTQEGVAWSNALRLSAKFPENADRSLRKLQAFANAHLAGQGEAAAALDHPMFPSFQHAAAKAQRRLQRLAEGDSASDESDSEEVWGEPRGETDAWQQHSRELEPGGTQQQVGTVVTPTDDAGSLQIRQQEQSASNRSGLELVLGTSPHRRPQQLQVEQHAARQQADRQQAPGGSEDTAGAAGTVGIGDGDCDATWLSVVTAAALRMWGAARRLPGLLVAAALAPWLALYRRLLPVWLRCMFWGQWPPRVHQAHASPVVARLIGSMESVDTATLARAGFNPLGQTETPLADLPAWRVEALLRTRVRDVGLYHTALTHKSALPQELRLHKSYERLEFLGDSVLSLTCRALLMRRCPNSDEGDMTRINSLLVSGAANARYASWLGLDRYVLLDVKSFREGAQHKPAILADAFEALLGALYLDKGYTAAQRFCTRVLEACVDWDRLEEARDYKSLLCRYAATHQKPQPRFIVRASGQREYKAGLQLPWWTIEAVFMGAVMGVGSSFDKRDAEQKASRAALMKLGEVPPL